MRDKRRKPRFVQAIIAFIGGYYWLPCPICRKYFGGQEECGYLGLDLSGGYCVCINCADEAKERTRKLYEK